MFHSFLLIDTGADLHHLRPGRRWIHNPYRVHQRLCMAFPSHDRKERDPHFLAPFVPADFSASVEAQTETHVHERRSQTAGFLFRIDPVPASIPSRHVIVLQSVIEPAWDYAFYNAREFLCARPVVRPFNPEYSIGQRLRFRLRANPTKRVAAKNERLGAVMAGKRIGLTTEPDLVRWLLHKGQSGGFRVPGEWLKATRPETGEPIQLANFRVDVVPEGRDRNDKPGHAGTFMAVRFDGVLIVTDPAKFRETVAAGIGSAKAFGFGLLSVARAES